MVDQDKIFSISSDSEFVDIALKVFRYQAVECAPYREYISYLGVDIDKVDTIEKIPFLPIEIFKSHRVLVGEEYQHIFTSSGTTGVTPASHYVKDLSIYEKSMSAAFKHFCDEIEQMNIYALLPSYLEREGSSLIYMIKNFIDRSYDGGFFLYDYDKLVERLLKRDTAKKTLLFGVTFALLDLVEKGGVELGAEAIVMETGGMKGRRRELPRGELHEILCRGFGVDAIWSEYGMCECLSQSYSKGEGVFESPPWVKILIRDINDPFTYASKRGGVNIIDLANIYSCSFLQTEDIGRYKDGLFTIEGRIDNSDIRGCNLLSS